jgi:hypothetical protein
MHTCPAVQRVMHEKQPKVHRSKPPMHFIESTSDSVQMAREQQAEARSLRARSTLVHSPADMAQALVRQE